MNTHKSFIPTIVLLVILATRTTTIVSSQHYKHPQLFNGRILLVINYNHAHYESVDFLQHLYGTYFTNIIFYGPVQGKNIHVCNHSAGYFSYKGLADAMQLYPDYDGYLWVHDDCIINPWQLQRFDFNNIIVSGLTRANLTNGTNAVTNWVWWKKAIGFLAIKRVYETLKPEFLQNLESNVGKNCVAWGYSDLVYIPKRYADAFITLSNNCELNNVFLEIAIPSICASIAHKNCIQFFKGHAEWTGRNTRELYTHQLDFIHPIKLSQPQNREFISKQFQLYQSLHQ